MVKLNKIYTKTGDTGDTGLVGGERRPKYDLRVESYGTVDEVGSAIGVARLYVAKNSEHDQMLLRIQHDLFDLGADLATLYPIDNRLENKDLRVISTQTKRLEQEIDLLNAKISPLNSFVLAGGGKAAAFLHLARTITRRAERLVCALATQEKTNPEAIKYLNRLSDFLFVLARAENDNGKADILWQAGINR
jgi:cob(I)alamin adenosyltransferase